ncbi:hypothetical protein CC1G_10905 [Coprinopsis cinerea okayama7|uniref:Transposase family Tnp2 protein n=1 Tax=Coprinopsis cinerea (strain Okayama-7 / 130 / ATCC MYA-4618 / FGSC 9003) TaxID=240176 RepID=A8P5X5_COPC7|nr:hypothetical protein CC1G_10905 [Coprinopsis cinerea okayama7\|eukprot:XP_001839042.2 hypothetical protein CC1G_10905 [Coprinopsis cinerea okayama7\
MSLNEVILCDCANCYQDDEDYRWMSRKAVNKHRERYGRGPSSTSLPPAPPPPSSAPREGSTQRVPSPNLHEENSRLSDEHPFNDDLDDWNHSSPACDQRGRDGPYFPNNEEEEDDQLGGLREGERRKVNEEEVEEEEEMINPNRPPDTTWGPAFNFSNMESTEDNEKPRSQAPAYHGHRKELPHIRMAYLQAVLNNVTGHLPVRLTNSNLASTIDMFEVAGTLPDLPVPARTLQSAKRRLGIDPDEYIIQFAACPKCWKHYTPKQMQHLESPACTVEGCPGTVYDTYLNAEKKEKRRPVMIIPHVPLLVALQSILGRKGMREMIRDSRGQPLDQNSDPNFVMSDMHDGTMWQELRTHVHRQVGNHGTVQDLDEHGGEGRRLTEHRFGLHLVVNIDWFGALKRPHSTGPIYISIADLPRELRFLQRNVICTAITPGPNEPTTEQLNHVMELTVRDAMRLKQGVRMEMWNDTDTEVIEEDVYADFLCDNCDTPGARKFAGFAGHTADLHPCPWCDCTSLDFSEDKGYDTYSFTSKNDSTLLKQKFYSRNSSSARQATILEDHGVRWAMFDALPGWKPATQTVLDFMHAIYLGVVAWLFTRLLFGAHMFPGQLKRRFENVINGIQWPSHATRLPKNLGENPSLKKADEWRRLLTVTPPVLWYAWMDPDGTIPDTEPPLPPNATLKTAHSRKRASLYVIILLLCAAIRLLSTRTISMSQAETGQAYLSSYCIKMLHLGAKLSPNHHFAMHLATMIKRFGPVYAWWLFAFERFNGLLEKVNTNGHDGGRIELTLLRNWVQAHLLYNLLIHLPDDTPQKERDLIDQLVKAEADRGGMAVEIAMFAAEASNERVRLPKQLPKSPIDIHSVRLSPDGHDGTSAHDLLFAYCQKLWPDVNLRRQFTANIQPGSVPFVGNTVARRLAYIKKDGIRFGSRNGARAPVSIEDIWLLHIPETNKPAHVCLLVRPFDIDPAILVPWRAFASLLGIYTSVANKYIKYEVIPATSIDCALALVPIPFNDGRELWVSVSFDRVSTEPEEEFEG